jgi:hypothetical protein
MQNSRVKSALMLIASLLLSILSGISASAHGGGLDSQGGHNCRVGSCAGTYHCHQARGPACDGGSIATLPKKSLSPKCVIESENSLSLENIAFLQTKLKSKGFNPGTIDGNYGGSSKKALNAYEKKNKLQLSTGSSINNLSIKLLGVNCKS